MALKGRLTKAEYEALPDPFKEHYVPAEGGELFLLQAEGYVEKATLDEFRETNRALQREIKEAKARLSAYDGIDPAEHQRLRDEVKRLEKVPVKDDKELEERIERVTAPLKKNVETLIQERDTLKRQNEEQTFSQVVTQTAQKIGIQPEFMEDVLNRARTRGFRLTDEGGVRAFRGDDPARDDAGKEITLDRFMREQPPAFFGQTKGTNPAPGARPGPGNNGAVKKVYNPSPADLGRLSKEIAAGTVEVVRDTP